MLRSPNDWAVSLPACKLAVCDWDCERPIPENVGRGHRKKMKSWVRHLTPRSLRGLTATSQLSAFGGRNWASPTPTGKNFADDNGCSVARSAELNFMIPIVRRPVAGLSVNQNRAKHGFTNNSILP